RVEVRPVALEAGEHQTHWMSGRKQHRTEQNRHVVAVARFQLEHPPRRVQQLHAKNVACVTDVSFHKIKERANFSESVLWRHLISTKYFDRFLSYVKIPGALLDQSRDYPCRHQCASRSSRHTQDPNARNDVSAGQLNHSQMPRILSRGTITRCRSSSTSISANDES